MSSHSMIAPIQGRHQPAAIIEALKEALEGRRLMSVTGSITGPSSVDEGSGYTLSLSATRSGGPTAVTGWTIAWGDGSTTTTGGDVCAASLDDRSFARPGGLPPLIPPNDLAVAAGYS